MNQEHRWPRVGTLTTFAVVLFLLGLAGGMLPAPQQAAAQTLQTETPRPGNRRTPTALPTPRSTVVGGSTAVAKLTPIPQTPTAGGPGAPGGPGGAPTPVISDGRGCQVVVTDDDGVVAPGRVTIVEAPVDTLPNRDRRYTYIRSCEVIYYDENGQIVPNKTFDGPIESCFMLTPEDVARAGGNPARLTILYYDEAAGVWVELEVVVDEANMQICGKQLRSGIIALAVRGQAAGLPNTSGTMPDATPVAVAALPGGPDAAPAAGDSSAAPAAAASDGSSAAPAAPASDGSSAAPAAAPAVAPAAAQAAAPAAAQAETSSPGPILALVLGVAAAVFAVILVLSRNMLPRDRDK